MVLPTARGITLPLTAPFAVATAGRPLAGDAPVLRALGAAARVGLAPPAPLAGDREGDAGALPGAALAGIALLREELGAASRLRRRWDAGPSDGPGPTFVPRDPPGKFDHLGHQPCEETQIVLWN